jgi:hypothetical protein
MAAFMAAFMTALAKAAGMAVKIARQRPEDAGMILL